MASINKIDIPKLKRTENYIIWSIRTKALLVQEDLLNSLKYYSISAQNNKALAIIKLLCEDNTLLYIRDETSAKKAWETLRETYQRFKYQI